MKGPVQMASFALLWNKIKISFHLTLEPMGYFWAWTTTLDGLFSELHEYETDYSGWAPSGTVENRWGIRSPVESILWNICFIQTTPLDGSVQFSSVAQSCPTLCDPMNHSTPGIPVHHQLPEFTQTHVHQVGDAIQPSHPLSSPSPPAPNPSQNHSLFQWVNSSHEVAKVLESQL